MRNETQEKKCFMWNGGGRTQIGSHVFLITHAFMIMSLKLVGIINSEICHRKIVENLSRCGEPVFRSLRVAYKRFNVQH